MNIKERMINDFGRIFGDEGDIRVFFAPGRVNLIGEHTDYNGGHVFPCALTLGTYCAVRKRADRRLRFYSANFMDAGVIGGFIDELLYDKGYGWANYVKGVIWAFSQRGYVMDSGFDFYCYGNIPNGSGLSSSASLELLVSKLLIEMYHFDMDMLNAAKVSQYAENNYIGVNCGIMDQFAIAMGKRGHAIFLDTSSLSYSYVPINTEGIKLIISNTNKKRGLGDSKYNERRSECEAALEMIRQVCDINSLGELTNEEYRKCCDVIGDEVKRRRARHAVSENQRTIAAVKTLMEGDIAGFGQLMKESHISLRDDYEVTGRELDILAEAAWEQQGVIGSRMTGAGFGGCTVSLVYENHTDAFIRNVGKKYMEQTGCEADFYIAETGGCPTEL